MIGCCVKLAQVIKNRREYCFGDCQFVDLVDSIHHVRTCTTVMALTVVWDDIDRYYDNWLSSRVRRHCITWIVVVCEKSIESISHINIIFSFLLFSVGIFIDWGDKRVVLRTKRLGVLIFIHMKMVTDGRRLSSSFVLNGIRKCVERVFVCVFVSRYQFSRLEQ